MRGARLGYFQVIFSVCLWGTWPLWLRASPLDSQAKAFWSLAFVALCGAPLLLWPKSRGRPGRRDVLLLAAMGLCVAGNQLTYFASIDLTSVARAALAHYLAPVLVAALAPLFLREPFDRRVPFALALAIGGLALLLAEAPAGGERPGDSAGVGLALASAGFYASIVLCGKGLSAAVPPLFIVVFHCAIGAALTLPWAAEHAFTASARELGFLALAAVCAGLLPATVFFAGLRRIPAQHAAVLSYLEPVVSAVLAWIVLSEALGWLGVSGGALILGAGAWVVSKRATLSQNGS